MTVKCPPVNYCLAMELVAARPEKPTHLYLCYGAQSSTANVEVLARLTNYMGCRSSTAPHANSLIAYAPTSKSVLKVRNSTIADASAKFVPRPSHVAPNGCGAPAESARYRSGTRKMAARGGTTRLTSGIAPSSNVVTAPAFPTLLPP